MTEKSPASVAHIEQPMMDLATAAGTLNVQPGAQGDQDPPTGRAVRAQTLPSPPGTPTVPAEPDRPVLRKGSSLGGGHGAWVPTPDWVSGGGMYVC